MLRSWNLASWSSSQSVTCGWTNSRVVPRSAITNFSLVGFASFKLSMYSFVGTSLHSHRGT